jgi:hypothetical protein
VFFGGKVTHFPAHEPLHRRFLLGQVRTCGDTLSFDNVPFPVLQAQIHDHAKMSDQEARQSQFAAPADLLRYLGLEEWEHREEEEWTGWYDWALREMADAGYDLPAISAAAETPMDARLMDALFVTESVGIGFLNTNFNRLVRSMQNLAASPALQRGTTLNIAELGGGCGLLAMWLLLCNGGEKRRCHIYDYSRNHVKIGEAWARRVGLQDRCFFHRASYAEVAGNNEDANAGKFDFVYSDRAISFDRHEGRWLGANGPAEVGSVIQAQFENRYREMVGAIRQLLKPAGIALVATGPARPLALETFCTQLRESGFSIDWDLYEFNEGPNIYLRYGNRHLLPSPEDEALAIHSSKLDTRDDLDWLEAEPLRRLFSNGQPILTVRYRRIDCPEYEWEAVLLQACGLFLLVNRSSQSDYTARTGSAAELLGHARGILELVHDEGQYEIISEEVDANASASLESLLRTGDESPAIR